MGGFPILSAPGRCGKRQQGLNGEPPRHQRRCERKEHQSSRRIHVLSVGREATPDNSARWLTTKPAGIPRRPVGTAPCNPASQHVDRAINQGFRRTAAYRTGSPPIDRRLRPGKCLGRRCGCCSGLRDSGRPAADGQNRCRPNRVLESHRRSAGPSGRNGTGVCSRGAARRAVARTAMGICWSMARVFHGCESLRHPGVDLETVVTLATQKAPCTAPNVRNGTGRYRGLLALHGAEAFGGDRHGRGTGLGGLVRGQSAVHGAEAQPEGQ